MTLRITRLSSHRRSAAALKDGTAILATLEEPATRKLLIEGVKDEVPPVSRISELLLQRHGEGVKARPVRQFVGTVVKSILAKEGYEVEATGIRLPKDRVFTTGSIYRKAAPASKTIRPDLWDRMLRSLETSELHAIIETANRVLKERHN